MAQNLRGLPGKQNVAPATTIFGLDITQTARPSNGKRQKQVAAACARFVVRCCTSLRPVFFFSNALMMFPPTARFRGCIDNIIRLSALALAEREGGGSQSRHL